MDNCIVLFKINNVFLCTLQQNNHVIPQSTLVPKKMKIIPPYQITSEILNLINEANEYLILVSPYVNFNNWEGIKTDIRNALKRNVKIFFYVRLQSENFTSWEQLEGLGITPKLIKNLHSKLYFNETH